MRSMSKGTFFTRSPRLAFLRDLVKESALLNFERSDLNAIFAKVNAHCAEQFPNENRGGWFAPSITGGAVLDHTPPHIIWATYAVYTDLMNGVVEPVRYLSQPLNMSGATAILLEPTDNFVLMDRDRGADSLTSILLVIPGKAPKEWSTDAFGVPTLASGVTIIGWHAA